MLMQPGQTISPNSNPEQNISPVDTDEDRIASSVSSQHPVQLRAPELGESATSTNETISTQNLTQDDQLYAQEVVDSSVPYFSEADQGTQETIEWTASEYIDHEKQTGWFVVLAIITAVASALVYFLSNKDIVASTAVVLVAVMFGIIAARKPRTLDYSVSPNGLQISQKHYAYIEFKSFTVVSDVAVHFVQLQPLQRFMPPIVIYYPPELEQTIVNTLQSYVPYEERSRDLIERFMSVIRF